MADWRSTGGIALKALVDKANNKIVYVESDEYFVDVLFSFLTLPIGAAIKLTSIFTEPPRIGCMNNIYESVKNLDDRRLQPEVSKKMLLEPKSAADPYFRNVEEFMLYDRYPSVRCYYLCGWRDCNLISRYEGARCHCGNLMSSRYDFPLTRQPAYDGVFVKGLSRFAVTDELEVRPVSTASTISLLSKLGLSDLSTIEERTIIAGADKVLNLLKCSLVSEIPLSGGSVGA